MTVTMLRHGAESYPPAVVCAKIPIEENHVSLPDEPHIHRSASITTPGAQRFDCTSTVSMRYAWKSMSNSLPSSGKMDVGHIGMDMSDLPPLDHGPIDLGGWFGDARRDQPLELEIGSGKGTFLVQQAESSPEVNYIGLEYARGFWRYAADRCRRRGLENVRMLHIEAGAFVRNYVPVGSLRCVHIYFPDPWPKKRHHKRRLVQAPFLTQLHRVIAPGGQVRLATDHSEYFHWMTEHATQVAELFERTPFQPHASASDGELVGTNFERKYRREGRPFHAMILQRRDLEP
jgi:tRNA (guanine-N7-)-methyltransferase